jgi:hypothetical protein
VVKNAVQIEQVVSFFTVLKKLDGKKGDFNGVFRVFNEQIFTANFR